VDSSGKVTTAGGYTIEPMSQFEWKICGPDGSSTRVWGDPHVETHGKTGGEKYDFKKDTRFVLPDGTQINVKCTPWQGNPNVTVTQSLEIIQGNDKVMVTDIDKGKGKTGTVNHGATAAQSTFATEQTFLAGTNVADWYLNGSEILSMYDGPDKFNVGETQNGKIWDQVLSGFTKEGPFAEAGFEVGYRDQTLDSAQLTAILQKHGALAKKPEGLNNVLNQVLALLPKLLQAITALVQLRSFNPYNPQPQQPPVQKPTEKPKPPVYDPAQHAKGLKEAFNALGAMFTALGKLVEVMASFKPLSQVPVGGR